MNTPKFLYFDLGKVLVDFEVDQMYRQMGRVAGIDPAQVREVLFGGGLQRQYELGQISAEQFYEVFCQKTGSRPDPEALARAGSAIFELNVDIVPVVAQLQAAGYRLGILSNTCWNHWEYCTRRFRIIREAFQTHALSCRIHAAKPDAAIYQAAAKLAGVAPREIFFTDDMAGHVAAAKTVGFDAVQYTSTPELADHLRRRGLQFNY